MKKVHKKAIFAQARYLDKLVKDIKSIRKGCRWCGGDWYCFTRIQRKKIQDANESTYRPAALKAAIRNMSDIQKAEALRKLDYKIKFTEDAGFFFRKKGRRTYRLYGNFHNVKVFLCEHILG